MKAYKKIIEFVENKQVFCGIDVDNESWQLCFVCDGEVVEELRMKANYDKLRAHLRGYYSSSRHLRLVYEAGFSGFVLYRQLSNDGYDCTVTPASLVPVDASKVKTDRRDAKKLAYCHSARQLRSVYVPPLVVESDRGVCRRRVQLVRQQTRAKNEIRSFLNLRGLKRPSEIRSSWSRAYLNWLSSLSFDTASEQFVLSEMLVSYQQVRDQLARVTRYVKQLSQSETYKADFKRLTCLRGVGLITAMTFLLEIHDFRRFGNEGKFCSYLGLTPSQHSSGSKVRMGHISRQGNRYVRGVLVESAWSVIRHDPHLREKYHRIKAKGSNGKKAIVAVARSLAVRLRRCLLNEEDYTVGIC